MSEALENLEGQGVMDGHWPSPSLPVVLGVFVVVLLRQDGLEKVWVRVGQNGVVIPALSLTLCVSLGELCSITVSYSIPRKSGEISIITLPVF